MKTGKLRWFNQEKGYGFIIPDEGGKDVFVHARELQKCQINPRILLPDMVMSYMPNDGQRGAFATEVKLVG